MATEIIDYDIAVLPMSETVDEIIQLGQRKLVVAQADVLLDSKKDNKLFILMVEESRGSAGGRAAGSGSRRINKIFGFSCEGGSCKKTFETEEESRIELFDIPYSAVAMDIKLSDGRPFVVQGVVDPELVASYVSAVNSLK